MNDIVLNYIIQAILGGASGYITNDYAINMLFKEYTPLKIGGVIKKTRGEFIENLSSMVENDIISKEKLQEILGDENFKIKFENLTSDFYNNRLYKAIGSDTWDKIITDEADNFVYNLIIEYSSEIYDLLIKNLNIKDFLSDKQLSSISSFFHGAVLDMLKSQNIIENITLSIYNDSLDLNLNNIIDKKIIQHIILNITEKSKEKIIHCDNSEFKKLIDLTGVEKAFNESIRILFDKKIKEIVNLNDDVIEKIAVNLLSYINSDKANVFINSLCVSLFTYGKKGNKSIFELLDSNFEENLKNYLVESIPDLTKKTVDWIRENNSLIDKLIEDSIDEVISESDSLKAKLLTTIKNTYLSGLSKRYSIIDKIVAYVESITEPQKLSINISTKIIEILNNITIREITEEAENNGLTPDKCTKLIIHYINKNITGILNQAILYIKEIKINEFLPILTLNDEFKIMVINKFKELYSSNKTQDFLIKKLSIYVDDILSKELGNLITEEKIKELSVNINSFVIQTLKDYEDVIEKWICKQIYYAAENFDISLSNETVTFLNEELYKKLEDYSNKLINTEISHALDKLNEVENLSKNSSDYLRSYAINNTETILKGSVKLIVSDNLNKLNDEELVDLANEFIGKELKPIMLFGGVLGVIAGIALAFFQNKALNPQEINIANMIMYALVGFLTNVIAINMIFKPYKENKFLSKIPFFKNFSLGYIVKNQKIFAENTSHFIDNSLLNKKSISDLFEKHEQKIKNDFIKTAADNDYKIIKNLLSKNKLNIINNVFLFSKNKIETNLNQLSNLFYSKIKKIKLSFIPDKFLEQYNIYMLKLINAKDISKSIYNGLNSKNYIKYDFIQKYLTKFIDNFSSNSIKNYIFNYEDKYKKLGDKQINEILSKSQIKKSEEFIANKTSAFLLSQNNRDNIFQTAYSLFSKAIDRNKTFEDIFDGKLKNYIDSHIPHLTNGLSKMLKNSIRNNKAKLTLMIQAEIKNQLGFIEKGMYTLMGGDEIIVELINKIVNIKIPAFLELKKSEINNIISISLNERFYKVKAEVLYTGLNKLQLKELTDNYINDNSERIENKIKDSTFIIVEHLENVKIKSILNLLYLDSFKTIFDVYGNELNSFTTELSVNTKKNKNDIIKLITIYNKFSYSEIFNNIKCEDSIKNLIDQLNKNNSIEKVVDYLMKNLVKYHNDTNIETIINVEEFIVSLKNYISNLVDSNEFEKTIKEIFIKTIDDAVSDNLNFISDESKDYLFNILIEASINSLKENISEILESVEFDKIAKEEIEKMEPKKIHEMFNSFGEKYFRRLMMYGFGGFVFGINMYIGIALTTLKIISQLNQKEN